MDTFELYGIDGLLTEEERAIRDTVRTFGDRELRPHIAQWFEDAELPARELALQLGQLGILGMHLEGYGCAGTGSVAYGLACQEMEAVDSGLRSLVSVQGSLAMYAIHRYGSVEQTLVWLPARAAGEKIGCFGLTEPDAGSNPAAMRTIAKRDGDDWVLNGSKQWITNGTIADVAIVWARTDDRIRGFVVPTDSKGFSSTGIHQKLSLRASVSSALAFDDLRLPASALLPEAAGLGGPLGCLNEARFGIIFGALGAARDSLETAVDYAGSREVFDKPLSAYQLTQKKIADMAVELGNGMLLALHLGRLKEAGTITPEQVSVGKLNNVRKAIEIARESRTILGANGVSLEYSPIRHAANLESVLTYEGTTEVHTLVVGKALTGQSAFS